MTAFIKSSLMLLLLVTAGAGGGLLAARAYLAQPAGFISGDYGTQQRHAKSPIVMIAASWCGFCAKTRAHFESRGIRYVEFDIDESSVASQWMTDLGAEGVPVVLIGDRQIRGFEPDLIDAAIAALDPAQTDLALQR
jgi:glutaredoxin